ncbi:MAG: glycosyltransferase family 2 protein, partial [Anaerolineales bacterium]
ARMIREYERKYWLLWKENTDLRSLTREMRGELAKKVREQSSIRELLREQQRIQGELAEIEANIGWRIVMRVQRLRIRLFPLGGRRDRIWNTGVVFLRAWLNIGFRGSVTKAVAKLRGRPLGQTPQADYVRWINTTEPSSSELAEQRAATGDFGYQPLISVLTPVYNPQHSVLQAALNSVLNQTYDNWELCLVDGNSEDPEVRQVLRSYASEDERVKVRMLENNAGISGNSQRALEMAEGEFIALMDHDDLLAPNALFEMVKVLNEDSMIDVIYSDEDKLSEDGKTRRDPWFKPDWSPDLLLSANYLMHSMMRRELVESVGGFDITMDGAQDWDLVLRCIEKTQAIHHIPKVLYHWRQVEGSAASNLMAKPWAFENQMRCVRAHLKRRGIEQAEALFDSPGFLRVKWPAQGSRVSIIILNKDKVEVLSRCITSIRLLTEYQNYEVLIVDSGSGDPRTHEYYETLEANALARIVEFPGEFNFSAANNLGARSTEGDILLFLNNDTEVLDPDWLEEMVRWAELPEIGAVGAKLLYPNGRIQHAGVIIGMQGHASHVFWNSLEKQTGPFGSVDWYRDYMAVTGACLMMRREVFEEVGGFDEGYRLAFSDVELCVRIWKRGHRVVYNPFVRLRHYEGQSRGFYIPAEDILLGLEQLQDLVRVGDPYFNPSLSYEVRIPSIALGGEESREARLTRLVEQHAEGFGKHPTLEA